MTVIQIKTKDNNLIKLDLASIKIQGNTVITDKASYDLTPESIAYLTDAGKLDPALTHVFHSIKKYILKHALNHKHTTYKIAHTPHHIHHESIVSKHENEDISDHHKAMLRRLTVNGYKRVNSFLAGANNAKSQKVDHYHHPELADSHPHKHITVISNGIMKKEDPKKAHKFYANQVKMYYATHHADTASFTDEAAKDVILHSMLATHGYKQFNKGHTGSEPNGVLKFTKHGHDGHVLVDPKNRNWKHIHDEDHHTGGQGTISLHNHLKTCHGNC